MRILITGVSGQDGSYLAEHHTSRGHDVFGMVRSPARPGWARHLAGVRIVAGDLLDQASLERILTDVAPDEVYNLAAVTAPGGGWADPTPPLLADITGLGVLHLCEAIRLRAPGAVLVHASSSAIYEPHRYGLYGAAKRFAHDTVSGYRQAGFRFSNAVLYSHTSPRQNPQFVARRITTAVRNIAAGHTSQLVLGNVDNLRDWGYAPDYMRAMAALARAETPTDLVVATGIRHSVRDFTNAALAAAGLDWGVVRVAGGPTWDEPPAPAERILTSGWIPFDTRVKVKVEAEP